MWIFIQYNHALDKYADQWVNTSVNERRTKKANIEGTIIENVRLNCPHIGALLMYYSME